jgi:hypothetical protein
MCRHLNRPKSNGVHNNKNLGLTQPKRLACWVRTTPTFMLCSPIINFQCGSNPTISPRHTSSPTLPSHDNSCAQHGMLLQAQSAILSSQGFSWPYGDINGLPCQRVTQRLFFQPSALIPLVGERSGIRPKNLPLCQRLNRPRSNRVHNNKNLGLTQPKRLPWWVRIAHTFMLYSPTINFWCGNNPTRT